MDSHETFQSNRCRIHRLSDAKIFNGWIDHLDSYRCHVKLVGRQAPIAKADKFHIEIFGSGRKASFTGVVATALSSLIQFDICSGFKFDKANENVRVCIANVYGKLFHNGERMEIEVVDVSENGLGVIAPEPVTSGSQVKVELRAGGCSIAVAAEVRYCRKNSPGEGQNRIGLLIKEGSRIDRARLSHIINNPEILAA